MSQPPAKKMKTTESHESEESTYEKQYQEDIKLYRESLPNFNIKLEECTFYETGKHPMHPQMFYQLSSVRGFNDLNGHTYSKYLQDWMARWQSALEGLKIFH
jgi:hypothetical protein